MDYLFLIPVNLLHRSLRTWLTLSGIVIGVLAIIILVSLGDGLKASITDQLDQFGSQNIIITPGSLHSMMGAGMLANKAKLSVNDVERIKRIPGVDFTSKVLIVPQQTIKFKKQEFVMSHVAYESNIFESIIHNFEIHFNIDAVVGSANVFERDPQGNQNVIIFYES